MATRPASAQAREMLAQEVAAQGPAWRNTADSIRSGYLNVWLEPALRAIERALREGLDEE